MLTHTDTYETSAWRWRMLSLRIRGQNQWSEETDFIHSEVTVREGTEGRPVTWEAEFS